MYPARRAGFAALVVLLAGCASHEPPPQTFPDIRFTGGEKLYFDAARVEIVAVYQPSFAPPYVEQQFPVPPQRALENWAHDRLIADNPASPNIVRVRIMDASARESPSPPIPHQDEQYSAHVELHIELVDAHGLALRTASAQASRTRTEQADSFQNTIDAGWYELTKQVTRDVTDEAERQMRASFYPYLEH